MKQILAYALLVIGLTNFVGVALGDLIGLPIAWLCPHPVRIRVVPFLGLFGGLGSIIAALTLFWLLGLHSGISIPIITAAWISFYFLSYHQSRIEWLSYLIGIFVGWFVFKGYFLIP